MVDAHNHHQIRTDRRHRATHAAYNSVYVTGVPVDLWSASPSLASPALQLTAARDAIVADYHATGGGSELKLHEVDPLTPANAAMRDAALRRQQFTDRMDALRYHSKCAFSALCARRLFVLPFHVTLSYCNIAPLRPCLRADNARV